MAAKSVVQFEMMDELLTNLGGVSPNRVRMTPTPGTATVRDVARLLDRHKRKFELVDGTLVEKIMGLQESVVAMELGGILREWNRAAGNLGMLAGADGPFHLMKKLVRIPDVSFTNWDRLPNRKVPTEPVPNVNPDLAVEVLSEGNTRKEMERKLKEYFLSEIEVVWFIDPKKRTVQVYTSPDKMTELSEADTLTGGDVLPGFSVPVSRLFVDLGDAPKPKTKKKR
ncbi:MAG: Uma2 family endonuclease [Planctomycetes bacterium]|nr:Uma2 family endonuclease [Planctomycetota bacterium]